MCYFLLVFPLTYAAVYRVFTVAYFHGGLLHIILNLMAMVSLGPWLERHFGVHCAGWLWCLVPGLTLASVGRGSYGVICCHGHGCLIGFVGLRHCQLLGIGAGPPSAGRGDGGHGGPGFAVCANPPHSFFRLPVLFHPCKHAFKRNPHSYKAFYQPIFFHLLSILSGLVFVIQR